MKQKLTLLLLALVASLGAWADVTVTLADASQDPYNLGDRSNSNKTFTSNVTSGLEGVALTVTGSVDHYSSGTYSGRLALKTSATSTDETWTLTAPEGYLIKGYSFSAMFASSNTATITAGKTEYSISSSAYTDVAVSGLKVKSTSFTVNASAADWIAVGPFTVTLAKIDYISLTFDKPGSATNNITVNVKDADGDAIPGVTASLESTSCTAFMTGSATALSRTENSVLAPAQNAGYGNDQGSTITYTFKVMGLPTTFTYSRAALDVYALTGGGGAQGNTGNTVREWTFEVATGTAADAVTSFVMQTGNDICTVSDQDEGLYHKLWTMTGTDKTATDALYIVVTLTKTDSNGCYAGLGEVQLYKPGATVQYFISDEGRNTVFTSDVLNTTEGDVITELPSAYQRDFCTYSAINQTMVAGENTVNVTVTYNLPFTVSTSFDDATWYYATIRSSKYLRADDNNKDSNGRYSTNSSNERTDVYKWAFFGNPYSYFYIANKGQGEGKYLNAGTVPTFETFVSPATTDAALWETITNGSGFTLRSITGTTLYINDAGGAGNLGYWNSTAGKTDGGGLWTVEEVTVSDKNALAQAITVAQALVAAPGVPGYPTAEATSTLNGALSSAQTVYADASGDYGDAYINLSSAIAMAKNNINYTPRTDVYYTITSTRGSMVYDSSHDSSVDGGGNNFLWYTTSLDNTNANHLWGFIEKDGNYYMYNVGKKQFATVSTTGGYQYDDKGTWVFSNTPAYVTFDAGINNSVAAPYVRVRATVATTGTTYSMSISTGYTGPVITYDKEGDGGIPMVLATSTVAVDDAVTAAIEALIEDVTPYRNALKDVIDGCASIAFGEGLNQYTANEAYTTALAAANAAYENVDATKSDLQTAKNNLESAISGLPINQPAAGSFLRIRSVSTGMGYVNAETVATDNHGNVLAVGSKAKKSIYYYQDGKLLAYNNGQYFVKNNLDFASLGEVGTDGASIVFGTGTKQKGTYYITFGGRYLYAGNSATATDAANSEADNCYDFWLEQVTELPVTINSIDGHGFASFYTPVDIASLPNGVKAYIATLTTTRVQFSEITSIPAGTAVVLYMPTCTESTEVNLTIGDASASTNGNVLRGNVATVARGEQEVLTMQKVNDELGFYKFNGDNLAGFKAYINIRDVPSGIKGFAFDFEDDATGINEELRMKNEESSIYNLAGQRLSKMQKGINIVNGKKVMVK